MAVLYLYIYIYIYTSIMNWLFLMKFNFQHIKELEALREKKKQVRRFEFVAILSGAR